MKITPSDIALYSLCRKKWQLKKQGAFREKKDILASALFSQALHFAAKKMTEMENSSEAFNIKWAKYEHSEFPIVYTGHDSWASLSILGDALLRKFEREFPEQGIEPLLAENRMTIDLGPDKLILQPDLIAETTDGYLVGDYKTSELPLDCNQESIVDQLTAGALLVTREFDVTKVRVLICNFVKSTVEIIWKFSERTMDEINAFVEKVKYIAVEMQQPHQEMCGAKADEAPCRFCEYSASCYANKYELNESLAALGMEV